jgi:hypothetical protein
MEAIEREEMIRIQLDNVEKLASLKIKVNDLEENIIKQTINTLTGDKS